MIVTSWEGLLRLLWKKKQIVFYVGFVWVFFFLLLPNVPTLHLQFLTLYEEATACFLCTVRDPDFCQTVGIKWNMYLQIFYFFLRLKSLIAASFFSQWNVLRSSWYSSYGSLICAASSADILHRAAFPTFKVLPRFTFSSTVFKHIKLQIICLCHKTGNLSLFFLLGKVCVCLCLVPDIILPLLLLLLLFSGFNSTVTLLCGYPCVLDCELKNVLLTMKQQCGIKAAIVLADVHGGLFNESPEKYLECPESCPPRRSNWLAGTSCWLCWSPWHKMRVKY